MKKLLFWSLALILLMGINLFALQAQVLDKKTQREVEKLLKDADKSLGLLNFHEAWTLCDQALKLDPKNVEANLKAGVCYLHSLHREKSLPYLQEVYKNNPDYQSNLEELFASTPEYSNLLSFYLAQAYHYSHLFKEAESYYLQSIEDYEAAKSNIRRKDEIEIIEKRIAQAQKRIQECKVGEEYVNAPVDAQIENMGETINSQYADYAPVIASDESMLMFTSRREGNIGGDVDPMDGEFFEDIYVSYFKNGAWTEPQNLGRPVNSKSHDACIALSPDGSELFVYQDNNRGTGSIFFSERNSDNTWQTPRGMGNHINTKHHEPSISMTADRSTVYFASTRPGGLGGLDIYKSEKQADGSWGEAQNLGPSINTPYDDDAPFIMPKGDELFFSSKGHKNMGGFDIFKTTFKNGKWTEPVNIGYPINTANDDIYFVLAANGKTGYYASAKEGGYGEKDLYRIRMPEPKPLVAQANDLKIQEEFVPPPPKITPIKVDDGKPKVILRGTVQDRKTGEKLQADLQLNFFQTGENISKFNSAEGTGKYESKSVKMKQKYIISAQKEGYLFQSKSFSVPESQESQEIIVNLDLEKLEVGAKINLKIFYDFDRASIRPESNQELERLLNFMQKHPSVQVEIAGHTDNIGTDQKNRILSERRAKSVFDFLKQKGISEARMRYKGYGFHKPIAPNQNPDGSDNPEGRQMNRRTECEIIGF